VFKNKYDFKEACIIIHVDWNHFLSMLFMSKRYLSLVVLSIKALLAADRDTEFHSRFANCNSLRMANTALRVIDMDGG
jgi:hypothetical protein